MAPSVTSIRRGGVDPQTQRGLLERHAQLQDEMVEARRKVENAMQALRQIENRLDALRGFLASEDIPFAGSGTEAMEPQSEIRPNGVPSSTKMGHVSVQTVSAAGSLPEGILAVVEAAGRFLTHKEIKAGLHRLGFEPARLGKNQAYYYSAVARMVKAGRLKKRDSKYGKIEV